MLAFVSLRSLGLAVAVILLGVIGAILAFGPSSGPRSSATSSTPGPPTASRPSPNSHQTALRGTSLGSGRRPHRGTVRAGGSLVWVVVPDRPVRSVVVFGDGLKLAPPSPAYCNGSASSGPGSTIWPPAAAPSSSPATSSGSGTPRTERAYSISPPASSVPATCCWGDDRRCQLWRPGDLFLGASLAFYYGANAAAWRSVALSQRCAVQAIFPGGMIPGAPLPGLSRSVRVLIQVGDVDTEAGNAGADAFWSWLAAHPSSRKRYQVVRSSPPTRRHPLRPQVSRCGCPTHVLGAA